MSNCCESAELQTQEIVLTLPGGVREVLNNPYGKEEIFWENRYGFIKVALQAHVPIIPIASIGTPMISVVFAIWIITHGRL